MSLSHSDCSNALEQAEKERKLEDEQEENLCENQIVVKILGLQMDGDEQEDCLCDFVRETQKHIVQATCSADPLTGCLACLVGKSIRMNMRKIFCK